MIELDDVSDDTIDIDAVKVAMDDDSPTNSKQKNKN